MPSLEGSGYFGAVPDRDRGGLRSDAKVTLIWSGRTDKYSVWENEFFNRSIRHIYTPSAVPGDPPEKPVDDRPRTGYRRGADGLSSGPLRAICPDGRSTSGCGPSPRKTRRAIVSCRLDGPLRQLAFVDGLYPGTPGREAGHVHAATAAAAARLRRRSRATLTLHEAERRGGAVDGRDVARTKVDRRRSKGSTSRSSGTAIRASSVSPSRRRRSRGRHEGPEPGPARARRPLHAVHLPP